MTKPPVAVVVVIGIVVAGAAFFGGMQYQSGKTPQRGPGGFAGAGGANFQGMKQGQGAGANRAGAGFTAGEIISKDDKSITVKMRDNGSKIIFVSDSTKITKNTDGALSDLVVGKTVSINGKTNSDGSLTADSVQLMPAGMVPAVSTSSTSSANAKQKQVNGVQQNGGFPGDMPPPPSGM
ncbi:MAG: DUF5666 domain-containing protein [Candidatus Gracilibacteria bacterium]